MSFSSELRAELARMNAPGRQEGETELAVLLRNLCRVTEEPDGRIRLMYPTGNSSAVKKCFTLIQKNVNISCDLYPASGTGDAADTASPEESTGDRKTETGADVRTERTDVVLLPEQFAEMLHRLGLIGPGCREAEQNGTIPGKLTAGRRNRAYLRGMFLCSGFMNDPAKRYHLEFRCISAPQADQLREVLEEASIHTGMTRRKSYYVVYIKDSEDIVMVLHLMGASVSLMATENARIYKDMRNKVNRRVNCETANIGKTVQSAVRQQEDIRLLRELGILQGLPALLRDAAELRESHPESSLTELGKLADPPVGRSGMNHRMRKLSALADRARAERGISQGSQTGMV